MKTLMALFATAIAMAPAAYADPSNGASAYQAYLEEIVGNGVVVGNQEKLVGLGELVCFNVAHGMTLSDVIRSQFGWFAPGVATVITNAAQHHLCPGVFAGQAEP